MAVACVLFLACALYAWRETKRVREFAALFLFLQTTCLGLFVALDLILFFVFFDLSIVAMYFIIAGWGHQGAARAALKFPSTPSSAPSPCCSASSASTWQPTRTPSTSST